MSREKICSRFPFPHNPVAKKRDDRLIGGGRGKSRRRKRDSGREPESMIFGDFNAEARSYKSFSVGKRAAAAAAASWNERGSAEIVARREESREGNKAA